MGHWDGSLGGSLGWVTGMGHWDGSLGWVTGMGHWVGHWDGSLGWVTGWVTGMGHWVGHWVGQVTGWVTGWASNEHCVTLRVVGQLTLFGFVSLGSGRWLSRTNKFSLLEV
jgi:hypothetical protein